MPVDRACSGDMLRSIRGAVSHGARVFHIIVGNVAKEMRGAINWPRGHGVKAGMLGRRVPHSADWYLGARRDAACREIIDSLRGEGIFDSQDAGPNDSGFRAGYGLGDIQVLGRQRR
jgi:hypothetical protein